MKKLKGKKKKSLIARALKIFEIADVDNGLLMSRGKRIDRRLRLPIISVWSIMHVYMYIVGLRVFKRRVLLCVRWSKEEEEKFETKRASLNDSTYWQFSYILNLSLRILRLDYNIDTDGYIALRIRRNFFFFYLWK